MKPAELQKVVEGITVDILLGDDNPGEDFSINVKPGYPTACWSFLPPHRIYVGDGIFKRAKKRLSTVKKHEYTGLYIRHEMAHLRETERNMVKLNAALKDAGVSFRLLNLFEDARIEHRDRLRTGKKFGWVLYETPEENVAGVPGVDFFLLIQEENENRDKRNPEVVDFYDRAIAAESTMDLIPLLQEWVAKFGDVPPPLRFDDELQVSFNLQDDEKFKDKFEGELFNPGKGKDDKEAPVKLKQKLNGPLLSQDRNLVDMDRAVALANRFLAMFLPRKRLFRSEEPSNRVSGRHLALDRPFYKHEKTVKVSVKKLCLIVDCSGSMEDTIGTARILAAALNHLAKQGKITGCLILSAVINDVAKSQVFDFPVEHEVIERIDAFGDAEGLNAAILHNLEKLTGADQVFVKTDGRICDEPIDKRLVKAKGITTCGIYAGREAKESDMAKHFDRFFMRESLEGLVDALLQSRVA